MTFSASRCVAIALSLLVSAGTGLLAATSQGYQVELKPSSSLLTVGGDFQVDVFLSADPSQYCTADPSHGSCLLGAYTVSVQFNAKAFSLTSNPIQYTNALGTNADSTGTYYSPGGSITLSQSAVDAASLLAQGTEFKIATLDFHVDSLVSTAHIDVTGAGGVGYGTGAYTAWNISSARLSSLFGPSQAALLAAAANPAPLLTPAGNYHLLDDPTEAPEPGSFVMVLGALALLGYMRFRGR